MTQKVLQQAGIEEQRVKLSWISSAEAQRFAQVATEIVENTRELGLLDPKKFELELKSARRTLDNELVRWTVGKEKPITEQGDVYGRSWQVETYRQVLDRIACKEYYKNLIYTALEYGCKSVRDINAKTGMDMNKISFLLADMEKDGMVEFKGMQDHKPEFAIA